MSPERLPLSDTLANLPPEWPQDPLPAIRAALEQAGRTVVVFDDDPTGAQTVYDVPVLTEWSVDELVNEFNRNLTNFYILTNTRSMPLSDANSLNIEIGRNLVEAARRTGKDFVVVSRSDSTLRGHFPDEVEAIISSLDRHFDAWILAPFFLEGGRYTIDDVHYVAEGEWLTPAGDTEFARDPSFGFRSSNLRDWVEEKTGGRVKSHDVASISLQALREGGPDKVAGQLAKLEGGRMCVVNAVSMRDLEVLNQALLEVEDRGKRFIYRTAASFIRGRLGQTAKPLLTRDDFGSTSSGGGLIMVGSYTERTTSQLDHLLENGDFVSVEAKVNELLDDGHRSNEISRAAREINRHLGNGDNVVVYTSRQVVSGNDAEESLSIIQCVSEGMVDIMRRITSRPQFLVAKGGNTSSDLATKGLNVKRCVVPGQIFPGVPVWELGGESRFPGLKYVVFPGNVGGAGALSEIVGKLVN